MRVARIWASQNVCASDKRSTGAAVIVCLPFVMTCYGKDGLVAMQRRMYIVLVLHMQRIQVVKVRNLVRS